MLVKLNLNKGGVVFVEANDVTRITHDYGSTYLHPIGLNVSDDLETAANIVNQGKTQFSPSYTTRNSTIVAASSSPSVTPDLTAMANTLNLGVVLGASANA